MHLVNIGALPDHIAISDHNSLFDTIRAGVLSQIIQRSYKLCGIYALGFWCCLFPIHSRKDHSFRRKLRCFPGSSLITDHQNVDYEMLALHAKLIVDTRGVYREPRANVVKA